MHSPKLKGLRIWVTRPRGRTQHLCNKIAEAGGIAFGFPVIDIEALPAANIANQLRGNTEFDGLIVVSGFAAELGLPHVDQSRIKHAFAVGRSTKRIMEDLGFDPVKTPENYSSEGLLALSELTQVKDQRWLIIKGEGGRTKLQQVLTERGAEVVSVDVYRRKTVAELPDAIVKNLQSGGINLITVTSGDIFSVILDKIEQPSGNLESSALVVPSERVQSLVNERLPKATVLLANSATDEDMLDCMLAYAKRKEERDEHRE